MSLGIAPLEAAVAAGWCLGGIAFALAYFEALRRTVGMFVAGGGWARPAALTVARIALAGGLLFAAATQGVLPLLAAAFGFLVGRSLALRRARRMG
jgi:hypothetical protein